MAEEYKALPAPTFKNVPLTQGLARNIAFNAIGWIWPIGLSIVSIPYILEKLGNDANGVFALVSLVAGYLSLLNSPVAMGNVRFMAEAYAREDWSELRELAIAGLMINIVLSVVGGLIMFLAADGLARSVFKIPVLLVPAAISSFRLAAASFFLNGAVSSLLGIPTAMRRFDVRNLVSLVVGTLNTVGIVMALWLGWGLIGAVMANVFSSALALAFFSIAAWLLLRKYPVPRHKPVVSTAFLRRLASFSSLLFAGQVISQIGLQIDRALVGILLGTSAVTYYTVPTKITDRIPGMMQVFSTTLYPLSSEAKATNKIDELRRLYHEMIRILLWLTAFIATLLIVLSKNFLALWIGPEMMANSWLVLALLAAGIIWRSAGSVAYQVSTGMGRADVNLIASIWTAICLTVPILFLTPKWGAPGAALGVFAGLLVSNVSYDLFAQRKLLGGKSLRESLVPYLRIVLAVTGTVVASSFLPDKLTGWLGLFVRAGLVSCIYMGFGLATGAIQTRDILFARTKAIGVIKRIGAPRFKEI